MDDDANLAGLQDPPGFTLEPAGDSALVVEFGDEIDLEINRRVHALAHFLTVEPLEGIVESIPTYRSLLVHYDPLRLRYREAVEWVRYKAAHAAWLTPIQGRRIDVPTVYGGGFGPDLAFVAQHNHLSIADVVRIHSGTAYTVYMMGFTPGYPYMGKLDPAIAAPRLDVPRTHVRAGSVSIAGLQTGVYPIDSPGGWRIIGYTPLALFDVNRDPPFLFAPGDSVRFAPIGEAELPHATPSS